MLVRLMFLQFFAISPTVRGISEFFSISKICWRGFVRRKPCYSNISLSVIMINILQLIATNMQ